MHLIGKHTTTLNKNTIINVSAMLVNYYKLRSQTSGKNNPVVNETILNIFIILIKR